MPRAHKALCPFCFQNWQTSTAAYRCTSRDTKRCPPEADEPLGRLRGIAAPMEGRILVRKGKLGQAFEVKKGAPVRCDCGAATRAVCPRCHSDLPQRFTQSPSRSMALIGTKSSGKTHFIAVVLHELEQRVGPSFGGSFTTLDDYTRDRIDNDLYPRLFQAGTVLQPTQSAVGINTTNRPLAARLTLGARPNNLVFFDAAGEDLMRVDIMQREGRYITQSDGLIMLLDPLQIPAVRDELAGRYELPAKPIDAYRMLEVLVGMLREARGISRGKIDVPIAIAISKVDVLRGLLGDNHPLFSLPTHDGRYDPAVARSVSESLRAESVHWLGERLNTLLQEEFERYSFFGLSALGENPVQGVLRNGVAPFRVEDPVLWMLDCWGGVPR